MTDDRAEVTEGEADVTTPNSGVQAKAADPEPMCDHICLKPASHVGVTPHFYGYELPSPRADRPLLAELIDALSDDLAYEVSVSPEVQRKVRAAVTALYGPTGDYHDAWWLQ